MTTGCEDRHDALVEHATGRLTGPALQRIERHLERCDDCRADLAVIRAVRTAPVPVPEGLESRIQAAVRSGTPAPTESPAPSSAPRHRSRRDGSRAWVGRAWGVPLAAAALLAAVFVLGREGGTPGAEAVVSEEYAPYGALPGSDGVLAGDALLSELSVEELERLLEEMES